MTEKVTKTGPGRGTSNMTFNVPDAMSAAIREFADRNRISVSAAVKRLVVEGLSREGVDVTSAVEEQYRKQAQDRLNRTLGGVLGEQKINAGDTLPNVEPGAKPRLADGARRAGRLARGKKS